VYDTDEGLFDSTDDYMGKATIFLKDIKNICTETDVITEPQWFPI